MNLLPEILADTAELRAVRRDIHAHPELRYEEQRTADVVAAALEAAGITVTRGLGRTGVVGTLTRGNGGSRAIGLRADMDALPVQEINTFAHRSLHAGKMHACGHDGHTTMLLGAARYLARHGTFDGTVQFIFQPAEEGGRGAQAMIDDGLFSRFPVDAVFALHNWPGIPVGAFGVRPGPLMASSNEFHITVKGVGSHAAMPHLGRDPIFVAVQIINGLQGLITRVKNPVDTAVLSITQLHAGEAINVVPAEARVSGTVRTFTPATLDLFETQMRQIVEGTVQAFGCTVEFEFDRNYPATINDAAQTHFAAGVMAELVGAANVDTDVAPAMASEDFSFMLNAKPGCYAFIGNGTGEHRDAGHGMGPCMLHNASYDFNDELLPLGVSYWVRLVERFFER